MSDGNPTTMLTTRAPADLVLPPTVSIIIPAYNEEGAIRETIESLHRALAGLEYELLVVNDGSTDGTALRLAELVEGDDRLRVIEHSRNRGYGAALKTGIRRAKADLIAITDADGTYPNERLPDLVDLAVTGSADMVVGARTGKDVRYSLLRRIPKVFLKAYASWIAGQPIPDINSGLRVFRREVAERFLNILPDGFSFTLTITLAMLTTFHDVRYLPIGYSERVGKSKIRPIRDTLNFAQLILRTGVYFAPLRVFLPCALLLGLGFGISLGYDVYMLSNITDKTVLLFVSFLNAGMFALLADMIDKRSSR